MRASIITPVFNAVAYIDACVLNVVAQGDSILEHIIVDGGSTDGTIERIQALAERHAHIRYLAGPDRGQSDAMNKGSEAAKGDVLSILNADDFYQPGAVARGIAALRTLGRPGLVVGDCEIINLEGKVMYFNQPKDLRIESLLLDSYLFPIPANPSAYFYSREVHDIVGGFDVSDHYAMDVEFLFTCVERVPVRYVPEHWGNFRLIPGAKTHDDQLGPKRVTEIIERHKKRLNRIQRLNMIRIWRQLMLRKFVGGLLWRAGLIGNRTPKKA